MIIDVIKVVAPAALAFFIGIVTTPLLTYYLYKYKMWKPKAGKGAALWGGETTVFNELHKDKEVGTPRMGGVVIWGSVAITTIGIWGLTFLFPNTIVSKLDFLSRDQTWIPLFTLLLGALVGLIDDFLEVRGGGTYVAGGLSLKQRLIIVGSLALFVATWFYIKLGIVSVGIPFAADLELGILVIPLFILVTLSLYAGGVIDGIDGLSGGVFMAIFASYSGIAFYQNQFNLAALCASIVGALLAFLWFNIPPARFYMTETGTMALTITIAVVAFMTDSLGEGHGVLALPIIAFPLVITVASNIIQIASKKLRGGKKIFLIAPLHHHFEAIGWPGYKVTMRYWVLSTIFAILGLIFGLLG